MGNVSSVFGGSVKVNAMMIGLDNSGKSTIVSYLKPTDTEKNVTYINPTVGFQLETFRKFGHSWNLWDMSGMGRYRHMWPHYYQYVQGIIFVVDATDKPRVSVAKDELSKVLEHPDVARSKCPVLILYNKSDMMEKKMSSTQISKILHLSNTSKLNNPVQTFECTALKGGGIDEGFRWLLEAIRVKHDADANK
jgi:small GTP-binding protein|eukprot:g2420.t1